MIKPFFQTNNKQYHDSESIMKYYDFIISNSGSADVSTFYRVEQ